MRGLECSACLAHRRPWVQSLVPKKRGRERKRERREGKGRGGGGECNTTNQQLPASNTTCKEPKDCLSGGVGSDGTGERPKQWKDAFRVWDVSHQQTSGYKGTRRTQGHHSDRSSRAPRTSAQARTVCRWFYSLITNFHTWDLLFLRDWENSPIPSPSTGHGTSVGL